MFIFSFSMLGKHLNKDKFLPKYIKVQRHRLLINFTILSFIGLSAQAALFYISMNLENYEISLFGGIVTLLAVVFISIIVSSIKLLEIFSFSYLRRKNKSYKR